MKTLFKSLNSFDNDEEDLQGIYCKYYDINDLHSNIVRKGKSSLLHLNIASLGAHKEEFEDMLSILELNLDFLGLSETRIIKDRPPIYDTSIDGYTEYHTPTESTKGGTALYINNKFSSKTRKDIEKMLYVPKILESTFAEIIIKGKKNIVIGCIYKHPPMDIDEFNALFEKAIEKVSSKNKEVYILGDFNIDLLKVDDQSKIDDFYNILCTHFLVPHITLPTRITSGSATLIDNIFSNNLDISGAVSGNLTVSISDHLPQFLYRTQGR